MANQIAFVSGHLDLTQQEFDEHYKWMLDDAIKNDYLIVVGDARGADLMAMTYLADVGYTKVNVYHMFTTPRYNCSVAGYGRYHTRGGYVSDKDRDTALTANSTYDIAWVRPGREKSGTAKNIRRRLEMQAFRF